MMHRKRYIVLSSIAVFVNILLLFFHKAVSASEKKTSDSELLELYEKTDYILHVDDGWIYNDMIRSFLWGIVTSLKWVNNLIEQSVNKIITMNDFYSSPAMQELMKVAKPLVFGLFLIALIVLGFQFMLNKIEKRNEILLNVLMAVSIVVVIPVLMSTANQILGEGLKYVEKEQGTVAGEMIKSNVADLQYYIDKGFKTDQSVGNKYYGNKSTPPTPLNKDNPSIGTTDFTNANRLSTKKPNLAVNEKLDIQADKGWFPWTTEKWVEDLEKNNRPAYDFLLHQRIPSGTGDGYRVKELAENKIPATSLGQEAYYRWHVNWGVLIVSLLVTTIALVITVVKVGRAIFDLAFHQIFGMFVAVTDLTGGQRIKKVLVEIANTFGVLFVMVFLLKIFMLYSNWVNGLKSDIGAFAVVLLLVAGAWAVIDAPDIVQRIMGIDAGLRSGWQALMGAYAGTKVTGGVAKGVTKGIGAVTKGTGAAYSGMKGITRGVGTSPTPTNASDNSGSSRISSQREESQPIPDSNSSQQDLANRPMNEEMSSNQIQQGSNQGIPGSNKTTQGSKSQSASIPSQHNRTGMSNVNQSKGINKGYTPVNSGLLVPGTETDKGAVSPTSGIPTNDANSSLSGPNFSMSPSLSTVPKASPKDMKGNRVQPQPKIRSNQNMSPGHKEPQFKNTLVGGMQSVRNAQAFMARAENTGFDIGQKIRKAGEASGRGAINTARAVVHPVQATKHLGSVAQTKAKQVVNKGVSGVRGATSRTIDKTKDVAKQINTPIGKQKIKRNK